MRKQKQRLSEQRRTLMQFWTELLVQLRQGSTRCWNHASPNLRQCGVGRAFADTFCGIVACAVEVKVAVVVTGSFLEVEGKLFAQR